MPIITIEVEVYCSCGNGLCHMSTEGVSRRGTPFITVEPCEKCLAKAKNEGFEEGRCDNE